MAKIKPSLLVESITGSVGGITFRRSAGDIIVYTTPRKRRIETAQTQTQKRIIAQLSLEWQQLTDGQRTYYAYLAYGKPNLPSRARKRYTARQLFIALHYWSRYQNIATQYTPSSLQYNQNFQNVGLAVTSTPQIFVTIAGLPPSPKIALYGARWFGPIKRTHPQSWHFLTIATTWSVSTENVTDDWEDWQTLPQVGETIAIRAVNITNPEQLPSFSFDAYATRTS